MDFKTTTEHQSTIYADVKFTLKVCTRAVRDRLRVQFAKPLADIELLQSDMEAIELPRLPDGSIDSKADVSPALAAKFLDLGRQGEIMRKNVLDPAYVQALFVKVEGITADGVQPDPNKIAEQIPEDLYDEIVSRAREAMELSPAEKQAFASPTTSAA